MACCWFSRFRGLTFTSARVHVSSTHRWPRLAAPPHIGPHQRRVVQCPDGATSMCATGSHMQQDMDICETLPHLSDVSPLLEHVHKRILDRQIHDKFPLTRKFSVRVETCVSRSTRQQMNYRTCFRQRWHHKLRFHKWSHFLSNEEACFAKEKTRSNLRNPEIL